MSPSKKPLPDKAASTRPPTYAAWKDAAAKDLVERHGIKANVREKAWRDWFIKGKTPSEAADRVAADYEASRPLLDRRGRWKR
jgi:hypothetical protein